MNLQIIDLQTPPKMSKRGNISTDVNWSSGLFVSSDQKILF